MLQTHTTDFSPLMDAVIDAGLMDAAVCTVQRHNGNRNGVGNLTLNVDADWEDLTDHIDLRCMAAHDIFMTNVTRSKEMNTPSAKAEQTILHVMLDAVYPDILQSDRLLLTRLDEDPITLDITGVERDSQSAVMTRLEVQLVTL